MTQTILLIDALSLIHRAYHAYPPLTNGKGQPIGAVYGVTRIFLSVVNHIKPNFVLVAFDTKAPTFRHQVFKDYKAKRPKPDQAMLDQIPIVKKILTAAGCLILIRDGFEADDLIGSFITHHKNRNQTQFIILSGDYDLAQLIDNDKVILHYTKGSVKNAKHINEAKFTQIWHFKPPLLVDYKALAGDPSDNIPGVKGIGKKTAQTLVSQLGSLENIYQTLNTNPDKIINLTSSRVAKLLQEGKETAFFSKQLATINTNVDIDIQLTPNTQFPYYSPDFIDQLKKYNFKSLLKMLNQQLPPKTSNQSPSSPTSSSSPQTQLQLF